MGTAAVDVAVDDLRDFLVLLPGTYRVVGTSCSIPPGTARMIVESDDIAGHDLLMTFVVTDVGSKRTVWMTALGRTERP